MRKGAVWVCTVFLFALIGLAAAAEGLVEHRAIVIGSDHEFTVENGVCSGEGTPDNPYIIEGWKIDAGYDDYGIRIHRTNRSFVIRNIEISGAAKSAIYLSYVSNALIEDCVLDGNWVGITLNFSKFNRIAHSYVANSTDGLRLYFSDSNQVWDNTFMRNDTAIWLDASDENAFTGNLLQDSHMGLYLNLGSTENSILGNAFVNNLHDAYADDPNQWDDGIAGNFWSGFATVDADEDGIWDSPYEICTDGHQDNYPMVSHPLVPDPVEPTCGI